MKDIHPGDHSPFGRPEISLVLFHPRGESGWNPSGSAFEELTIPAEKNITLGGRFYAATPQSPNLLFFHGNGEIVEDYDDIASAFIRIGLNFIPVDYRGYGRSTGSPGVSAMMRDCHAIFSFVKDLISGKGLTGPLLVMGRSLGSASALELAAAYPAEIRGLVIESGFAFALPLLRLLGVNTSVLGITEEEGFNNIGKIGRYHGPLLVIHAEKDHIIPFSDGKALFDASPSARKEFLEIKRANHNNILQYGINDYFRKIGELAVLAQEE